MTQPTFGISFLLDDTDPRPAVGSDLSVVGIVAPSPLADAQAFPLNQPVLMYSDNSAMSAKLGAGPIYDALIAINDQLAELQIAAKVVVVRVAEGANIAETIANIRGDANAQTGIYALLKAGNELGVIPRLICAPGYTSIFDRTGGATNVAAAAKAGGNTGDGTVTLGAPAYLAGVQGGVYQIRCIGGALAVTSAAKAGNVGNGAISALSVDAGAAIGVYRATCMGIVADGGIFVVEDPDGVTIGIAQVGTPFDGAVNFTINDGAVDFALGDAFTFTVADAVPANGGVFSVRAPDGTLLANAMVGAAYASQIAFTLNDGVADYAIGDGFDVTVTVTGGEALANPICAALPAVLDKLLGVAVVGGPTTNRNDAVDWRETLSSKRLIPVVPAVKVVDGSGNVVTKPIEPHVIGRAVRRDFEKGGFPFHSWANQPINGIVGPSRSIGFSLTDGATEGQDLLSNNIGILIRGEIGVETAIADGGFVFVGTDTCADDDLWRFYNVVRGRDYIHLMFLRTLRFYLGKHNITGQTIQSVLNTMEFALRDLKADQHILGYKVGFTKDQNSPEQLRLGKFTVRFQAEEPPVLRKLVIQSARYRPALDALLEDLLTQLNLAA